MSRAYEIKTIHHWKQLPKEILKKITAKGADLLKRTIDSFKPPSNRGSMGNGNDTDGSGDEGNNTPKKERVDLISLLSTPMCWRKLPYK
jgi:hypothetical protein